MQGARKKVLMVAAAIATSIAVAGGRVVTDLSGEGWTFVWCMYDFGADARREGIRFGLNDKGLVAYDHETRKDAFWFYKANWTKEPFLHLVGSRMASTTNSAVTVMAFWNGEGAVSLKVNGENRGSLQPDSVNTAIWRDVNLRSGDNEIEVSAGGMSRSAHWRLKGEHIR